jgi:hypothetical protein
MMMVQKLIVVVEEGGLTEEIMTISRWRMSECEMK